MTKLIKDLYVMSICKKWATQPHIHPLAIKDNDLFEEREYVNNHGCYNWSMELG